jgi:hypothetical protein
MFVVCEGRGRIYRRKDDKYLIYLPTKLSGDSIFPFNSAWGVNLKPDSEAYVKISFELGGNRIIVEKWKEPKE